MSLIFSIKDRNSSCYLFFKLSILYFLVYIIILNYCVK